jgi:hypothetical protein
MLVWSVVGLFRVQTRRHSNQVVVNIDSALWKFGQGHLVIHWKDAIAGMSTLDGHLTRDARRVKLGMDCCLRCHRVCLTA